MSSISNIYLKKSTLETLLKGLEAKNLDGISIDVSINDEANQWNQNVSCYVAQSKEEREAKKARFYVANGRTVWTDGNIKAIPYKNEMPDDLKAEASESIPNDLPF